MKKEMALIRKWQKILRLQDWEIKFKYAKPWEFFDNTKLAEIHIYGAYQSATILSLRPEEIEGVEDNEVENTIIHELIHLLFDGLPEKKGFQGTLFERAINHTAEALLELDKSD